MAISLYEFRVLFRHVDTGTGVFDFCDKYLEAIFDSTQLFEFFEFFQRRLRQFCNLQQKIFAISVYADMTQIMLYLDLFLPADGRKGLPTSRNILLCRYSMFDA